MTTFGYLSVMVSIILGLGMSQLFAGVGNLLQVRQRVKPYGLHSAWILILIICHVHMWWSFWALRDAVAWTYVLFLYVLMGPAALVIASRVLMPGDFYDEVHAGKFDLRHHYDAASRLFFAIFTGVVAWAMFFEPVMGVRPLLTKFRLVQVFELATIGSCALSRNRTLHWFALLVTTALLVSVIILFRFRAGAFDFQR